MYAYNNKHSLRSNTKGYDGKTHYNDSQNSDTTVPGATEQYHLEVSLQAASLEIFGYAIVCSKSCLKKKGSKPVILRGLAGEIIPLPCFA
jgi:hypothetical protein